MDPLLIRQTIRKGPLVIISHLLEVSRLTIPEVEGSKARPNLVNPMHALLPIFG